MVCAWVASLADFLLARQHSRTQSPSFLLVEWICPLQIKPSGSGGKRKALTRHVVLLNFNRRS